MEYIYEALTFSVGALLMAITSYSALWGLFSRNNPNTIIVGGGDAGAVFSMLLFSLGGFLVSYSLFKGLRQGINKNSYDN